MKSSNLDLKVILAIVLMAVVICSSCCFSIFMIKGNIAHADSTNGNVEDNLFSDTYMNWNNSGVVSSAGDSLLGTLDYGTNVYLYNLANTSTTYNINTFVNSGGVGFYNNRIWFDGDYLVSGSTYTFTVGYTTDYACRIRVRNGDGNNLYSNWDETATANNRYLSLSFTYTGTAKPRFLIYFGGTLTINYFKLELGSSFTGYVPRDYGNYGYNQGLEDATEDAYENFAYKGGYELLGSLDLLLNLRSNFFTNYSSSIIRNYPTNYLKYFTYKGVQYGEYHTTIFIDGGSFDYTLSSDQPSTSLRPAIRIAKDVTYVGDSLWLTFDSNYNNSYCLFCVSQSGNIVVKSFDFFTSIYMNGVLASQIDGLVQGEVYDFYIGALSDVDIDLNLRSIYGGIGYYAIYSILSAYNVGEGAYARGLDVGYDNGKNDGITEGKIIGRNEAWAEAQEYYENMGDNIGYSFSDMLYAIVDSPVKVLGDMLNFDFLGFNLKAFFFSIVTIAIIILIVKRFI